MKYEKFVSKNDERYMVTGSARLGFDIYKLQGHRYVYYGRSQCDTPYKAINDIERKSRGTYY